MADCSPLTCLDPRGRTIKRDGHTTGQASRWLIERARAFRRETDEMKNAERRRKGQKTGDGGKDQ